MYPRLSSASVAHRDRDPIYGDVVRKRIAALSMNEVVSAKRSPWQNPYAERGIGSIRRECTDHLIPLNEAHLRKILGGLHHEYRRAGQLALTIRSTRLGHALPGFHAII